MVAEHLDGDIGELDGVDLVENETGREQREIHGCNLPRQEGRAC
jgi:hypothetical protein